MSQTFTQLWATAQLTQAPRPVGPADDPTALLMGTLRLGGADFHVELYAVRYDADDCQEGVLPEDQSSFDDLNHVLGGGAFETITVDGREYALMISPFME